MEHTPKEEERLREEFINKIELDRIIKDIGYTGAKGTIADYWLKIRREAIAEEREKIAKEIGDRWLSIESVTDYGRGFEEAIRWVIRHLTQE